MTANNVYYMEYETFKRNTAAFKAPDDIYQIFEKEGLQRVLMPEFPLDKGKLYGRLWLLTKGMLSWKKLGQKVPAGSVVIFQHPQPGKRLVLKFVKKLKKKGIHFVAIIHDLESLRGGMQGIVSASKKTNSIGDNEMLKQFDAVVCHNEHMKKYLIGQGFEPDRLISLQIFDYLSDVDRAQPAKSETPTIAIAGNLAKVKAGYIPAIFKDGHNEKLKVNLYGTRYEPEVERDNLIYHGAFPPEELAAHLEGDFGLVWDGTDAATCAGNTGEYLKFNNPHKCSMYLSAGMPVIVWSQAAIADFVRENGVGIAVDSLYTLQDVIESISPEDYAQMAKNAAEVSKRLRSGYYTLSAIDGAVKKCR